MWRTGLTGLLCAAALLAGCKTGPSDADAIRTAITQHLASLNSLNLSGIDLEVNSYSVQGKQAHALVTFRPKGGAPAGAGMQVGYLLEKQGAAWTVVKTESVGGMISHPAAGASTPAPTGAPATSSDMPNFHDILQAPPANPSGTLPPGHPPIVGGSAPKSTDQSGKPN